MSCADVLLCFRGRSAHDKSLPNRRRDRPAKLNDYVSTDYMSQLEMAEKSNLRVKLVNSGNESPVADKSDSSDESEAEGADVNGEEESNISLNGDNTVIIVYDDTGEGEGGEGEGEGDSSEEGSDSGGEEKSEEGESESEGEREDSNDERTSDVDSSAAVSENSPSKRSRGRPKSHPDPQVPPLQSQAPQNSGTPVRRKVGRPRLHDRPYPPKPPKPPLIINGRVVKRKRGRPRKEESYSPSGMSASGMSARLKERREDRVLVTVTDLRRQNNVFRRHLSLEEANALNLTDFDAAQFLTQPETLGEDDGIQEVPVIEESRDAEDSEDQSEAGDEKEADKSLSIG